MPAKSTKKPSASKKNKKSAKKTKSEKTIEKDIKKAVDKIPGIAIEHKKDTEKRKKTHKVLSDIYDESKQSHKSIVIPKQIDTKKHLLWTGVTTLAILVFVLWIWNMRTMIYDVTETDEIQPPIWQDAKNDFSSVLATIKEEQKDQIIEDELEEQGLDDKSMKEKIESLLQEIFSDDGAVTTSTLTNTTSQERIDN